MSVSSWFVTGMVGVVAAAAISSTACSGSSDTGCGGLSACCASLSGAEAQACNSGLTASQGIDQDCTAILSGYQSSGLCSGGGGGGGGFGADAGSGCSGLSSCCSTLPVAQNPSECWTVANNGTDTACNESLATYHAAGVCGSGSGGGGFLGPPSGTVVGIPFGSCSGRVYAVAGAGVSTSALTCAGSIYVLCDGVQWDAYTCTIPAGYSLDASPDFASADGGGATSGGMDASSFSTYGECSPCNADGGNACGGWESSYACVPDPRNHQDYCAFSPAASETCPKGTTMMLIADSPSSKTLVCYPTAKTCQGWTGG